MSLTTTVKRGNLGPVWDKPVPDRLMSFCPKFLSFCSLSLVAFGAFTYQKLVTNQRFGLKFCAVRQDTFYPHQENEQGIFYKKLCLFFIGWSFRNWKITADFNWLKIGTFQPKFDRSHIFYQHSQPLYNVMQKELKFSSVCKD